MLAKNRYLIVSIYRLNGNLTKTVGLQCILNLNIRHRQSSLSVRPLFQFWFSVISMMIHRAHRIAFYTCKNKDEGESFPGFPPPRVL